MRKHFVLAAAALTVYIAVCNAQAAELVTEFSGRGATTTREFEVKAPWILDWRVNSEYQRRMKIEIHLVDSVTGFHKGQILKKWEAGNGVRLFTEGGRYRLRISTSFATWRLKVEELTADEVELYTPRQ